MCNLGVADPQTGQTLFSSYGINCWVYSQSIANSQGRAASGCWGKMDNVRNSTETPLMLDSKWRGGGPGYPPTRVRRLWLCDLPRPGWTAGATTLRKRPIQAAVPRLRLDGLFTMSRHGKAVNACFRDGSARNVRLPKLRESSWSRNYDPTVGAQYLNAYWNTTGAWIC
jgi:hypothetical protein